MLGDSLILMLCFMILSCNFFHVGSRCVPCYVTHIWVVFHALLLYFAFFSFVFELQTQKNDNLYFHTTLPPQGLKRSEQHSMLDLFRSRHPSSPAGSVPGESAAAVSQSHATTEQESSRIKKLERLIKKPF